MKYPGTKQITKQFTLAYSSRGTQPIIAGMVAGGWLITLHVHSESRTHTMSVGYKTSRPTVSDSLPTTCTPPKDSTTSDSTTD